MNSERKNSRITKSKNKNGKNSTTPTSSLSSIPTQSPPSPCDYTEQDEIVPFENVTVKFRLNSNQVIAQVYPNCLTLGEVKTDIGRRFEVPAEFLALSQAQIVLTDGCLIRETSHDDYGIHEFGLELMPITKKKWQYSDTEKDEKQQDVKEPKLDLDVYYNKHRLPDFITVCISPEDSRNGKQKNIVVEIHNKAIVKPFLCGYVDKSTGIEYLDAFTQTGPFVNRSKYEKHVCRDTQTFEHKIKKIDTMHDQTAQCWLDGNNVRFYSEATDYYLTPRQYTTYDQQERLINRIGKIRLIQRNFRRYKWTKWMKQCAYEYRRIIATSLEEARAFQERKEKHIRREEIRKQFPKTRDDFELLYSEITKWKKAELKRIAQMFDGAARIAEVNILLDKEIQLLSGLDRQRKIVYEAMKDFRQEQLLKKMGEPIEWVGYGDTKIHLDLLRTQRVRFLTEVYKDLQKPLPKDERLDLITKVRELLLDEQAFPEFAALFDLFDRERNLLVYAKHCDVEILRKRQNILFVELIKFDPEPKMHNQGNRMCEVCQKVKPYSEFAIRTRQYQVDTCNTCYSLKAASTDNTVYKAILRSIQREERKKHCSYSFAFILQVDDVRYIINRIWHGHSILSKCEDLPRLRLPRWKKREEWAPWNCICITDSEEVNHNRIEDLESVYDLKTRLEIASRHYLSKQAFRNLTTVSVEFTETGKWRKVGLNKQRNIPLKDIAPKTDAATCENENQLSEDEQRNYKLGKIM